MDPIIIAVIVVGVIGLIAGLGLSIFSVLMAVKTDEKVERLREALPGANCGACGYSGCDGYAEALAKGEVEPGACTPGGESVNRELGEILGVEVEPGEPKAAFVLCNGTKANVDKKMFYQGIETCRAANMLYSGNSECNYGCLGFGDCEKACPYNAVTVRNGVATIDRNACTACGICVSTCPKGIITLLPKAEKAVVVCSNRNKGAVARNICHTACIGCGKCIRTCEHGAVTVKENLAAIAPEACVGCGKCVEACPMDCIKMI